MDFSTHQTAIFDFATNPSKERRHAQIVARAGSGKTTTVVEMISRLPRRCGVLYMPFNKAIAEEGSRRLAKYPNVTVKTFNAFGFGIVLANKAKVSNGLPIKLDTRKNETILKEICGNDVWNKAGRFCAYSFDRAVCILKDLMWQHGDADDFELLTAILDDFDLWPDDKYQEHLNIARVIEENWDTLTSPYVHNGLALIDFADQLYLPHKLNLQPDIYQWIVVDEAQDLSAIQWNLVHRLAKRGNVMFVGDPMQCIYEFRGASAESMRLAAASLSATSFTLPICYRCGTSIIELAREFVPDISSPEGMHEGEVCYIDYPKFFSSVLPSDAVLARSNAVLIRAAYGLRFRYGKSVYVKGDALKKQIDNIVKKCGLNRTDDRDSMRERVNSWFAIKQKNTTNNELPRALVEAYETLSEVITRFDDWGQCHDFLTEIFAAAPSPTSINLSTIHKFKGQEADRVFYLEPRLWETERPSENRIKYVGITRARKSLFLVEKEV